MRHSITGLIATLLITFFVSLSSTNCSKKKEYIYDTVQVVVHDTTIVTVNPSIDLVNDLIVYYPFNNNANDASGNDKNLVVNGNLQFTTDQNNRPAAAALFDGTSTFLTLADTRSFSPTAVTIALQLYTTSTDFQAVFTRHRFDYATNAIWDAKLFLSMNDPFHQSAAFSLRQPEDSPCEVEQGTYKVNTIHTNRNVLPLAWYHLAFVFDNGVQKIYLNGKLSSAATLDYKTAKTCPEAALIIGAWRETSRAYFKGKMDEFRIYNRALSDLEIAELAKGQ